jgi:hypothetical protein
MRDSRTRTAAQSATVLTHTTHFISHFSFRQNPSPSLHDIALTGHRPVDHIPYCHHVRFRPTCREPCGCSESSPYYTHYTVRPRPPAALPRPSRAGMKIFTGLLIRSNSQLPSDRATNPIAGLGRYLIHLHLYIRLGRGKYRCPDIHKCPQTIC